MSSAAPIAVLSFVTTFHVAALLILSHRHAGPGRRLFLLPAISLGLLVWFLPAPGWLLAGAVAQVAWVVACERLLPRVAEAQAPAAARPALAGGPKRPAPDAGFVPVKVLSVVDETPEIRTFRMERPDGFAFRSGQFLMVRVAVAGKDEVRCYSISSSPEASGYLEISVRRQGCASAALHETVRAGGVLPIRGPGGSFVYPEEPDVPLVLHAGGVGVTPMISMLRHAASAEPGRPVTFLYTAKAEPDVAFRDELALLARRAPGVRVYVTLSRGEPRPGFLTGRMDLDRIAKYEPDLGKAIHLVCGPAAMIAALREGLASLGVPADRIRFEAFESAVAAAGRVAVPGGETWGLTLARSGRTVRVSAPATLLDAAEAEGVAIDSLCRAGQCGTCRTRLLSGRVEGAGTALSREDSEAGWVLPCVSVPRSDCTLDA